MTAEKTLSKLSPIGLGTSRVGSFSNPASPGNSRRLLDTALNAGITVFDTSNIYGQGDSERTIGLAIAGKRDRVFLVTKAGRTFSTKYRLARWLKPFVRPLLASNGKGAIVTARRADAMSADWRPAHIAASLTGSLRRLRTDHVDGFLLHSPPAEVIRDPQIAASLARLKSDGKVRNFGISCDDRECLEAALEISALSILQLPWDLLATLGGLAEELRRRDIIVLAREVIALQPDKDPLDAIRASLRHPAVSCTLVGTTRIDRVRMLAALAQEISR